MTLSNHINYVWFLSNGFVVRMCTANLYTDEISPIDIVLRYVTEI